MATAPENNHDISAEFGANDWLIEEMYDQYQKDPSSVDESWRSFFADQSDSSGDSGGASARAEASSTKPAQEPAGNPGPKPAPPRQSAPTAAKEPATDDSSAKQQGADKQPRQANDVPTEANTGASTEKTEKGKPKASKPSAETRTIEKGNASKPVTTGRGPENPGSAGGLSANRPTRATKREAKADGPKKTVMKGAPMRTAKNMDASLSMPTATTVRNIPMKLVIDERQMINDHLARTTGGKVSFTHILGFAMVQAIKMVPDMNVAYEVVDGKPNLVQPNSINLGLAIDIKKGDTRQLLVPNIKQAEDLNFAEFWKAYEDIVKKSREGALTVDDFAGTTCSLTNPGGIGTSHSVPRLMNGQGVILGVGSIDWPPEFQGASDRVRHDMAVSKITTLTSTYDHRVIQGAVSGEFLKVMHELLIGQHDFYDEIFAALRVPYQPIRWAEDDSAHRAFEVGKGARVLELIDSYRSFGHLMADIDPLEYRQRSHDDLLIESHGLTLWDLDREFPVGRFASHEHETMKLRDILTQLRTSYCGSVGVEYMHIRDVEQRRWMQQQFEVPLKRWPREEHLRILDKLNEAEIFETFLQTKFIGQKRFSLEGSESMIVMLDEICEQAADDGLDEVCIGMPHRGRLNVLANIVGKSYGQIFREFEGTVDPNQTMGTGDVKYHLGAEGEFKASSGKTIKTSVAANPSHLEAVNPVLEGITRAKQDHLGPPDDDDYYPVLPVLLHGDASFAGQGVNYEVLQMSQLRGFKVGGTVHVVVNNQVGFTTAPTESRTSVYCTDVAKSISAPVLHVNGDDPEAVARTAQLAYRYVQRFHKDVVIDLVTYRRRGHNEGDDPSFTQPQMYDLIEQKRSVRKLYTESLIGRGDITTDDAEMVSEKFRARLESVFQEVREQTGEDDEYMRTPFYPAKLGKDRGTAVDRETLDRVIASQVEFPDDFAVHPKVLPQLQRRVKQLEEGKVDWATAELLSMGSLLLEGRNVRLVGQDTRRGTFSQRFAAIVDRRTNEEYVPLKHLSDDQGQFYVYDSLLSEYAAMGFEYGYSVASPQALVCWEGQFGDFANGAQVIADEFISSGFAKWQQKSGVVLLLPHGYEGQGPDHSSSRMERWLQLSAEGALAVCQPSSPASYFHLLRQHTYVNWHRPLVILTPKSMLRAKAAMSSVDELTDGRWQPAMGDPTIEDPSTVRRVILCSGKIRWELYAERAKRGLEQEVAILTLERLYPLPDRELAAELEPYREVTDVRWVQDEPYNQGAYMFLDHFLPDAVAKHLPGYTLSMRPITRPAASAPSVGLANVHKEQAKTLLDQAFAE
ncbi:multifunctional oxoglutarate decarboxylase/oxoglutarate dehydrogenase thiamine pyrophosphate-binding subunit/dihydrolipoyllysine-residue succinyltransferase subunit [Nigerium massiliense]|uniref:multifunctional oxoglutarate decarboxylase/oxoglutarate dehydrogenase thiamine pyrophosphate-binding subunit/dihydrolipoyllysine-residue succinyltransferase subunit n=1 Tax=Nigerium massiliense TaxID=1522317 RepID=UPI000907C5A2|nr:multifunctional oxoglutarate decarboxylase/oxoglutarate dehydrogenase thiamine pyrophosphate-binding subunit/dihydrolipoyllysine-residue succinyltransferase subunit [Nigerium massiliense]